MCPAMIWQANAIAPRTIHGTVDGRPNAERCWMTNSIAASSNGSHAAAAMIIVKTTLTIVKPLS